jgi:hypothetical protein
LGADIVLDRVLILNNRAGRGGGVATFGGSLDAERAVIAGNVAQFGAGVSIAAGASSSDIVRSSFWQNAASGNSGAAIVENSTAIFENSTIAANLAANGSGGVTSFSSAAGGSNVTVRSTTLGDNGALGNPAAGTSLWAIATAGAATLTATDTVVTEVTDPNTPAVTPPCLESPGGTIVSNGGNVEWPTTTCDFEVEADPKVIYAFAGFGGAELFAKLGTGSAAIDAGGNDCPAVDQRGLARPAGVACDSGSWETHPPDTTVVGPDSPTNSPEVTFTSSEPNSTFECRVDGVDPWTTCTSPFAPALADGEHTVEVRAIDAEGDVDPTPGSATFVVDTTAPEVVVDPVASPTPDPTPDITFSATDENGIAGTTCKVDDTDAVPCTSPFTTPTLEEGEHTVTVEATDNAGNTGSGSVTFVVDLPGETTSSQCTRESLLLGVSCAVTVECPEANSGCTVKGTVDVRANRLLGLVHGNVIAATPVPGPAERSDEANCGFPQQLTNACTASTEPIAIDPGESATVDCSSGRRALSLGLVTLSLTCTAELTTNVGA